MNGRITVSGVVQTDPRSLTTVEGLSIATFALRAEAEAESRLHAGRSRESGSYVVTALDALAGAIATGVRRGDRVVVAGSLHLAPTAHGDIIAAELHADAVGLDIHPGSRDERAVHSHRSRAVPS
jgi:hypothetical protein